MRREFEIDPAVWGKGYLLRTYLDGGGERRQCRCALGQLLSQIGIEDRRLEGAEALRAIKRSLSMSERAELSSLGLLGRGGRDVLESMRLRNALTNENDYAVSVAAAVYQLNDVLKRHEKHWRFKLKED